MPPTHPCPNKIYFTMWDNYVIQTYIYQDILLISFIHIFYQCHPQTLAPNIDFSMWHTALDFYTISIVSIE